MQLASYTVKDNVNSISDIDEGSDGDLKHISLTPAVVNAFRIVHLNCHSLLLHREEVFGLKHDYHFDVLALSETWLDLMESHVEVLPSGCKFHYSTEIEINMVALLLLFFSNCICYCWREFHGGQVETLSTKSSYIYVSVQQCYCVSSACRPPSKMDFYEDSLLNVKGVSHIFRKC